MPGARLHRQRIGPYEPLMDIGAGGMGTVSLARASGDSLGVGGFGRLVAVKRPRGALASDPDVLGRFLDEARLLAQIHHANVLGIHQIGSDGSGHFVVLDYIEGGALDELISRSVLRRRKLPPPIALRIAADLLAGLHAVHEAADVEGRPLRMLHRDVSTQNVLVGLDGLARLADFGIAEAVIRVSAVDRSEMLGRVPYLAPEYLERGEVDRGLDVYAAGVTLWTALAGDLPWPHAPEPQLVRHILDDGVPPLASRGILVAPDLEAILARACERDPAKRFATAREMLAAIDDLGRRTGALASHAEVASLVHELLGRELAARKAAIARKLSEGPPSRPPPSTRREIPASPEPGPTATDPSETRPPTSQTTLPTPSVSPQAHPHGERVAAASPDDPVDQSGAVVAGARRPGGRRAGEVPGGGNGVPRGPLQGRD